MHVHLYRRGTQSKNVRNNMLSFAPFEEGGLGIMRHLIEDTVDHDFDPASFLSNAQLAGVEQAMLLPVAAINGHRNPDARTIARIVSGYNDFYAEAQRDHPGKLISLGTLYPALFRTHPGLVTAELDRAQASFIGIKFHSTLQRFDPTDPKLQPLFEAIVRRKMFMQFHMGFPYKGATTTSTPEKITALYLKHCAQTSLPMVWAHLGGQPLSDRDLDFLVEHDTIFLDFAYTYALRHSLAGTGLRASDIEHDHRYDIYFSLTELQNLGRSIDKIGLERLFLGSDFPFASSVVMMRAANSLFNELGLNGEERDLIYRGNAQRFFGMVAEAQPDKRELLQAFT